MGLVFVVGVVLSRRRPLVACGVFAGCAAIATLATAVGFAAGGGATTGRLLEGIDETVFAGVGVGLLLWGRGERQAMAAVGLGFLALVVGSLKLAVLTHGVVLSALGPTAARACVVLALWSGAAAIVSGGWLLAAKPLGPNRSLRFHDRAIDHR
jgi:hypothetical protein